MKLHNIELDDKFFVNQALVGKVISIKELESHDLLDTDLEANYYQLVLKYSRQYFNSRTYPLALAYYDNLTTIYLRDIRLSCLRDYDSYAVCSSLFDGLSRDYAHYQIGRCFNEECGLTVIKENENDDSEGVFE